MTKRTTTLLTFAALGVLSLGAARAHAADYNCVPVELAHLSNRIHVLCAEPRDIRGGYPKDGTTPIRFFAVPLSDPSWANRFTQLVDVAMTAGHVVQFKYTAGDTSGAAFGCGAQDCRTPFGILLMSRKDVRVPL